MMHVDVPYRQFHLSSETAIYMKGHRISEFPYLSSFEMKKTSTVLIVHVLAFLDYLGVALRGRKKYKQPTFL